MDFLILINLNKLIKMSKHMHIRNLIQIRKTNQTIFNCHNSNPLLN